MNAVVLIGRAAFRFPCGAQQQKGNCQPHVRRCDADMLCLNRNETQPVWPAWEPAIATEDEPEYNCDYELTQLDGEATVTAGAAYQAEVRRLTAVPPFWPDKEHWKRSTAAAAVPFLHHEQTVAPSELIRLKQLWSQEWQQEGNWQQQLADQVQRGLLPETDFRAGALHARVIMWETYCEMAGFQDHEVQLELDIIRNGVRLQWCSPLDEYKKQEARHRQKVTGVRNQLSRAGYAAAQVKDILEGPEVASVALPNLLDDEQNMAFAKEQIDKNIRCGALIPWPFVGTRPALVLPLAVVKNSYGKRRLIVDGRLLNLRQQRLPFKYETASDAVRMLTDYEWAWTLDVKAGYHHVLLHPDEWTYVGLCFEGQFYVHAALPFGLSQSPERFTRIMQLTYRPLVAAGAAITGMVDDSLGAAKDVAAAARQMGKQIETMGLLGWTLNGSKSMTQPGRLVQYLGYEYDLEQRRIALPQGKIERIMDSLSAAREARSGQMYRRAAGQVAAAKLAFPFPSILIRGLLREQDEPSLRDDVRDRVLGPEAIEYLLDNMAQLNGQPWDRPVRAAQVMVVDTSEVATGAHILGTQWRAMIPLAQAEVDTSVGVKLSSTESEARGIFKALQEGLRGGAIPSDGTGAVQVVCDNRGTVSAMTYMRGGRQVFPVVARVHLLARRHGLVLSFAWKPRQTPEVVVADAYSKLQDPTDWRLSRTVLKSQVMAQAKEWVDKGFFPPDVDMMASCEAHQVPTYVAGFWDGACAAQDAMAHNWAEWPAAMSKPHRQGRPRVFVFPPPALLADVLFKVKQERATVWLVCSRYMREIDEQYLAGMPVRVRFPLSCRNVAHVVKPTRFNPASHTGEHWKTPLQVLLITWEPV